MVIRKNDNHKDHDLAFTTLLQTARRCNVKLNYDKLKFKCTEVNFYGKTYTTDGCKPPQSKVTAIVKMPAPSSKKEVQSFIGMINYLTKFSPRLNELSKPIRELIKEKIIFNWGPEHQESFNMLKKELVRAPILTYYNPWKETVLQTDASTKGLGACLLQDEKPIYFASKALTETQRGYVAIEIKSLAIAWAVEKFHHFLYGCHFILEMDQKPFEAILSRSINQATPTVTTHLDQNSTLQFHCKIHSWTKESLSRLPIKVRKPRRYHQTAKTSCVSISHQLPARSDSLQEIRQATQANDKLVLLKHTIMTGWPNNIKEIPQVLHLYWTFRKELTIKDGLILKGTRIVIPNTKCEAILKQIHDSHLGLTKCKLCAKQAVYWPGLNDQLEQLVLNCQLCLKYSRSKKKSDEYSTLGQEVPIFPWTKLATDLFHFEGHSYLLLVDYTNQFPIVRKLTSMMAHHIADHFKQIFAEYGWPDTLISDNGLCYASEVFKGLMTEYHVNHIMSSPHYPQSSGLAKKYVQIVKNLFHKAKGEGQDLYKCLMTYRNTPLSNTLQSLMQILSNRATRSTLPLSNATKRQMGLHSKHLRVNQNNQHIPTHDLCLVQTVMYQDATSRKWYLVKITKLCDEPRSYIISTENGTQYRKTQKHLKP